MNPNSDVGALARIGSDQIRNATALARDGKVYDLGLEINERMPQGPRGAFVPFSLAFSTTPEGSNPGEPFQFAAEVIIGALHTSTHLDAFVHVQSYGRAYGGASGKDIRSDRGFRTNGVETVPPIVGRAVFLDVAGMRGAAALEDGYEISIVDLQNCLANVNASIEPGDIVLIRTGKLREFWADPEAFQNAAPGVGVDAAEWLFQAGMAVLGTDTTGTEPMPLADPGRTTHASMLIERGVHLIENVYLDDLAADTVVSGLFVCLPLRITGATGSWVRPILLT
jgi:kynurenine formamidase